MIIGDGSILMIRTVPFCEIRGTDIRPIIVSFFRIRKSYSFIRPFETSFVLICSLAILILSLQIIHTPTR